MDNVSIVMKVFFFFQIYVQTFVEMEYSLFRNNAMMGIKIMVTDVQIHVKQKKIGYVVQMEIANTLSRIKQNQHFLYPLLITEFLKQENQSQYVKIRFSQYVKQEKNSNYKETIQLQILELDQSQYKIVTQDINAANYQSLTDVQYIFKIEILTNQQQQPILEIVLTEQLYNENQAPLLYLVDHFQLQSVYQLSEEELKYQIFFCNLAHIQSIHCLLYQACYQFQAIIYQFGEFQTYFKSNLIQNLQMSNTLNHQQYIFNQAKQYNKQKFIEFISMSSIFGRLPVLQYNRNFMYFSHQKSYEKFEYYDINPNILEGLIIEVFIFSFLPVVYMSIDQLYVFDYTLFAFVLLKQLEMYRNLQEWPKFIRFVQKMKRLIFKKLKLINLESIKITILACGWDLIFMEFSNKLPASEVGVFIIGNTKSGKSTIMNSIYDSKSMYINSNVDDMNFFTKNKTFQIGQNFVSCTHKIQAIKKIKQCIIRKIKILDLSQTNLVNSIFKQKFQVISNLKKVTLLLQNGYIENQIRNQNINFFQIQINFFMK